MAFILEKPPEEQDVPAEGGKFVLQPPAEETTLQSIPRHIARSASRIGETVAGIPGDISELADSAIDYVGGKLGLPTREEQLARIEEKTGKEVPAILRAHVPTSADIRKGAESLIGDYIKPQTEGEEFSDEIISDTAALVLGRKLPTKGGTVAKIFNTAKPLLVSIGSNVAKELVGEIGGGDKAKTFTKLGTMFLLNLIGRKSVGTFKKELYKEADKLLPKDASISTKDMSKNVSELKKELLKGGSSPSTTPVVTKINELEKAMEGGKIGIDELKAFKQKINEITKSLYDLPRESKIQLKNNFGKLRSELKSMINEYGKKNPEFLKAWNKAEEVHGAIESSRVVRTMIANAFSKNPKIGFGTLVALGWKAGISAIPKAAGVMSGLSAAELLARVIKSPILKKHYVKVINSALKQESIALSKNLSTLDREMKKEGY